MITIKFATLAIVLNLSQAVVLEAFSLNRYDDDLSLDDHQMTKVI